MESGDNSWRLYLRTFGGGDSTLVFLPGLAATTRYWESRVERLGEHFRICLVDLLGFGESPKPWVKYSVDRHVESLQYRLAEYAPFTLVGHSIGALLAIAYAARYSSQIDALVLMGAPFFSSESEAYRYYRRGPMRGGWIATNIVLNTVACILTRRVFGAFLPYLIRSVPPEVAEDLVKHTWRSSTSSLWQVVYRFNADDASRRIDPHKPVLCIHGDQDVVAPLWAVQRAVSQRPGWELSVLAGADHHPILRETDTCLVLIDTIARRARALAARST